MLIKCKTICESFFVIFLPYALVPCWVVKLSNFPHSIIVCGALDHISVIVIGCNKIIQIPLFHSGRM